MSHREVRTMGGHSRDGRCVMAGFDASPAGERALRWAAAEASLRGVALRICHAWQWPYPLRTRDREAVDIVRGMGALVLDDGVRLVRAAVPDLDVEPVLVRGTAPGALVAAGAGAALIVIGARGIGGFDALPVGSAALQVPAHTDRPVVVVPANAELPGRGAGRIVVGVDGSPASETALRFALREARLRDASVAVICAWWDPAVLPGPERLPFIDPLDLKHEAKARFEKAIAPYLAEHPGVPVERRFVVERPQRVLADNARDAALLVVGDRGIGSSPRTLLGAVTRAVLHEAATPVVIVHEHDPTMEET